MRCAARPAVTRALVELFRARHDPGLRRRPRGAQRAAAEDAIRAGLAGVAAINDDRLLRLYWAVIGAILRTNAFAPAGADALAFKFDSALVPEPAQAGAVARDLRLFAPRRGHPLARRPGRARRPALVRPARRLPHRSARADEGAAGQERGDRADRRQGRVLSQAPARSGRATATPGRPRASESYKLFIRSLLSITDNIVDDKVVHPAGVVIHDGEDPYFVVAADKGTASFSDTANAIAEEHGFWLGDAFASGGSKGYDHKAMGITASGAWLSVQRHFLEMGVDVQKDPVRVAGCGDMSGDVFGNGMLLSKSIRLVAAFDHRHIFIDPDPDPAASWKERKRLFELPRSSWADYSAKLISKGGGVFPRTLKRIPLSREARAALGIEAERARSREPDQRDPQGAGRPAVVRRHRHLHQGRARRATPQVGDPGQRRACASSGDEVRAKVIGEGANLGVTQAGRIEFALQRRAHQHRLHRQFGRGRLLGQRGQHQDRARGRQARRAAHRERAASRCSRR